MLPLTVKISYFLWLRPIKIKKKKAFLTRLDLIKLQQSNLQNKKQTELQDIVQSNLDDKLHDDKKDFGFQDSPYNLTAEQFKKNISERMKNEEKYSDSEILKSLREIDECPCPCPCPTTKNIWDYKSGNNSEFKPTDVLQRQKDNVKIKNDETFIENLQFENVDINEVSLELSLSNILAHLDYSLFTDYKWYVWFLNCFIPGFFRWLLTPEGKLFTQKCIVEHEQYKKKLKQEALHQIQVINNNLKKIENIRSRFKLLDKLIKSYKDYYNIPKTNLYYDFKEYLEKITSNLEINSENKLLGGAPETLYKEGFQFRYRDKQYRLNNKLYPEEIQVTIQDNMSYNKYKSMVDSLKYKGVVLLFDKKTSTYSIEYTQKRKRTKDFIKNNSYLPGFEYLFDDKQFKLDDTLFPQVVPRTLPRNATRTDKENDTMMSCLRKRKVTISYDYVNKEYRNFNLRNKYEPGFIYRFDDKNYVLDNNLFPVQTDEIVEIPYTVKLHDKLLDMLRRKGVNVYYDRKNKFYYQI